MGALKFAAWDHQGKAQAYLDALERRYERTFAGSGDHWPAVAFVLSDNDVRGRRSWLQNYLNAGCVLFFLYPHSGRPNIFNDIRSTWHYTTASFVAAAGHADIMRRYGYDKPIHVVGWHLCPLQSFKPREQIRNVLFAPIHPRNAEKDREVNRAAFERLHRLSEEHGFSLIVRHIRELDASGLTHIDGVQYVEGDLFPAWEQIDSADMVVGHQTFAYMAVARGVPTLMMAEDMPTHLVPRTPDTFEVVEAQHWDRYADLLAYPLDILRTADPWDLMQQATRSDDQIRAWRTRMIGSPFDEDLLLEYVQGYVEMQTEIALRISRYQGRRLLLGDSGWRIDAAFYIANPHGAIHSVSHADAIARLQQAGFRLATDGEIESYLGHNLSVKES